MTLIRADAQAIPLADESVHCVVTSPPYWGLRDYGIAGQLGLENTPEEYVECIVAVFREVRRVLRPEGTLWMNLGDCYATGAGRVGDHPGGGEQGARWRGEAQRHRDARRRAGGMPGPSQELNRPRGPMTQPNRMPIEGLKPKDLVGVPWRVAFALQADGWFLRQDIVWHKPNPMPESVRDRCTKAHEYLFLLTKSRRYYFDAEAIREAVTGNAHSRGNGVHAKARDTRPGTKANASFSAAVRGVVPDRNKRSVWTIATQPYSGAHFATFPTALVEPCILAGCPAGGVVLDPFVGSGTTVEVATKHGRHGVGIDLSAEYLKLAQQRTSHVQTSILGGAS